MARYTVVVDDGDDEFFGYVPALPGCTSVGQTRGQALDILVEAIHMTWVVSPNKALLVPDSAETIAQSEVDECRRSHASPPARLQKPHRLGFIDGRQSGSHLLIRHFRNPQRYAIIPIHRHGTIPPATLRHIVHFV